MDDGLHGSKIGQSNPQTSQCFAFTMCSFQALRWSEVLIPRGISSEEIASSWVCWIPELTQLPDAWSLKAYAWRTPTETIRKHLH